MTISSNAAGTQINIYTGAATERTTVGMLSLAVPTLSFTGFHRAGNRTSRVFFRHPLGTTPYGVEMTQTDGSGTTTVAIQMNTWDSVSTAQVNGQNETTYLKLFNDQTGYAYLARVVFMIADNNYSNACPGDSNA